MKTRSTNRIQPKPRTDRESAFTLVEVIVAAAVLAGGLMAIVEVFPYGVQASQRSEDITQASLLAQTLFEGLKNDPRNFPIIPGLDSVIIPIPGNGYDDDTNNIQWNPDRSGPRNAFDINGNGRPDVDYDGLPEFDALASSLGVQTVRANGLDDDGDGVIDDTGDSGAARGSGPRLGQFGIRAPDGNYSYDPEPSIDEEYSNGIDDDGDGLIDEDIRLGSVRILGSQFMLPLLAGDGFDNDGDGEDNDNNPRTPPVADGIDNDEDGMIDEGFDEEIWDLKDNDDDGMIDEDCMLPSFPFMPSQFPPPFDRYGWQVRVGAVPDNGRFGLDDVNGDGFPDLGDGIDNDGDGLVDEELKDGIDMDFPVPRRGRGLSFLSGYTRPPGQDGMIDEDTISSPLPNWRRVEILITWGGDGEDNDGDYTQVDPKAEADLDNPRARRNQQAISYGTIGWGIDEEKLDGIDNDLDGETDEDVYTQEFVLVGFINLSDPSLSFSLNSGQPRGLVSQLTLER